MRSIDDPLALEHLGLAIKRQVPGVFAHQHMRDHGLGRQPALDQALRRRRLHDRVGACSARIFGPARHQNAILRRDHVEPLRSLLADHMHRSLAAWAGRVLGRDHHLDARQMCGQRLALVRARFRCSAGQRSTLFDLGLGLR